MLEQFFLGAHYVGKGAGIIQQAKLRRFVIIPIIINLFVFFEEGASERASKF